MTEMRMLKSRYFWLANSAFWVAVLGIFVHIQYGTVLGTAEELSWGRTWVLMSPWFLTWIPVTAVIFKVVSHNARRDQHLAAKILSHAVWAGLLLSFYWLFCSSIRILLRDDSLSDLWDVSTHIFTNSAQLDIAIYVGVLVIALSINFYHRAMQESMELRRVQNDLVQEQLKALRTQLNPHFLFNTLNTIASLVRLKREKDAVSALSELSMMLRKILENKEHTDIKVKDEISFIQSYLTIQKMRFADKLNTNISVEPDCMEIEIPNMLLQPLVENAVQHGSQMESNSNPVNLNITRSDNELMFVLTNKISRGDKHDGFGIGLSTTRERLNRLYQKFRLELTPLNDGVFQTILAIPIGAKDA